MAKLASYDALWIVYPDYINFPDPKDVKDLVGGAVNAAWITNTCAIRMSRALNYTGNPLPADFKGMTTVKGGDGYRYAFRVREMRNWLTFILGAVDFEINKTAGTTF
ncbi:MAG TPA: T6SS effector amidase Tae4 family protein, partial [Nitrosospira sp.]